MVINPSPVRARFQTVDYSDPSAAPAPFPLVVKREVVPEVREVRLDAIARRMFASQYEIEG
jgi:hypothetical protein